MEGIRVCTRRVGNVADVVRFNVNEWYTTGDLAWIITAGSFVWLMIPGVGFFYSGLSREKSALSVILLSFISLSVVTFQVPPSASAFPTQPIDRCLFVC